MISLKEALETTIRQAVRSQIESVALVHSLGRILATDYRSDINMPPFDKSAVDGFACRKSDLGEDLEIIEVLPAGVIPRRKIASQQCAKIMTGAMVPDGADCVFMIEETTPAQNGRVKFTGKIAPSNICFLGEDVKEGDVVLQSGNRIAPQHIAVLAAFGVAEPCVFQRVKVGILSTGDELVEPDQVPGGSQIRNSNGPQLCAQVEQSGGIATYYGIVSDRPEVLSQKLSQAVDENDIVLLTGGVSMGDFDYVPQVMKRIGVQIFFERIEVQPGKPTVFGKKGDVHVFGLPGNPVSAFVIFEILVKPFLQKCMGLSGEIPFQDMKAGIDFFRKKQERTGLIPVQFCGNEIFPIEYHGSAHINAYTSANGILVFPSGQNRITKGDWTHVRPI